MANIKLKDATKELTQGAEQALNEASRLRKSADQMMAQLREMEKTFNRKAQEAADLARKEEERRAKATQSRAYTAESGYVMGTVSVFMGGVDITSTVFTRATNGRSGTVHIGAVTGDVVVRAWRAN